MDIAFELKQGAIFLGKITECQSENNYNSNCNKMIYNKEIYCLFFKKYWIL